jgi:hypothetical protein
MATIWLGPTGFIGDPSLVITYPFSGKPSAQVTTATVGSNKWIYLSLSPPPSAQIEDVSICYTVGNSNSFISRVLLLDMSTPNQPVSLVDVPVTFDSTTPVCEQVSLGGGVVPTAAVTLALGLEFTSTLHRIVLGAVGVTIQSVQPADQVCLDTIADLRALAPGSVKCPLLLGYHIAGDGGGGIFYWDSLSAEEENAGTVIAPNGPPAPGRWKRLAEGNLSVKWFGAIGDGNSHPLSNYYATLQDAQVVYPHATSLNDEIDSVAIQSAIASIPGGIVFFPPGTYKVTSTLMVEDKPITLAGTGARWHAPPLPATAASTIRYEGTGDAIIFKRVNAYGISGSGVRDLGIEGLGAASTGAGLRLLDSSLLISVERVWIRSFAGPGGVGLRLNGIDFYLADVHLQGCDVGLLVDSTFQTTAVNLMVNQNITGGAKFIHAGAFRWIGGLVQGVGEFGVLFEPGGPGFINAFTLDGLYFEGDFTHVQAKSPPGGGSIIGITNLTIQNNRLTRFQTKVTFFDLTGVLGLVILNNRFFFNADPAIDQVDTLLKLRDSASVVIGLSDINFNFALHPDLIDIDGVSVIWLGGDQYGPGASGIGIGTPLPPKDQRLAVGQGVTELEDLTVGGGITNLNPTKGGKLVVAMVPAQPQPNPLLGETGVLYVADGSNSNIPKGELHYISPDGTDTKLADA